MINRTRKRSLFSGNSSAGEGMRRHESMRRHNRLYEAILSATPDLVYVFDLDHRFTYANQALLAMWGKSWNEAKGKCCLELGYAPWHAQMHDREIEQVIASRCAVRGEVPFIGTNGRRIYDYIFVPVFDTDGRVEAIAGTTRDITERKEHEQQTELLGRELQHRVKNTLAVIRVIASKTFGADAQLETFSKRLTALSEGLDILNRQSWVAAPLQVLVEGVLAAHATIDGTRIKADGPELMVRARSVVALALALNELATNAAKYGSLSNADGHLDINWRIDGDRLRLTWIERRGPPVTSPLRKGFDSKLIQDNLAKELGGWVQLRFEPEGLVCEVDADLNAVQDERDQFATDAVASLG